MRNFRDYDAWNNAIELSLLIYKLTSSFPQDEKFCLKEQLHRAAISIPSNIAEGAGRSSGLDFAHFLDVAIGSAYEVETQLEIAKQLNYINEDDSKKVIELTRIIEMQIASLIKKIR